MALFLSRPIDYSADSLSFDDFVEELARTDNLTGRDKFHHIADLMSRLTGEISYIEDYIKRIFYERDATKVVDGYGDTSLLLGGTDDFSFRMVKWLPEKQVALPGLEREALVYDLLHNHDFNLVTKGIFGDGYETDIYRVDASRVLGAHDEDVAMEFQGRFRLSTGSVIWYEQFNDIHTQYAPPNFSMSFNVIPKDRVKRYGQFIFDRETSRIKEFPRNGSSRTLALLSLLCDFGFDDETQEILTEFGASTENVWLKIAIASLLSERSGHAREEFWDKFQIPREFDHALAVPGERFSIRRVR